MKIIGVIPARFGSTRFQGKPLKKILGKPLLQWVIEGSKSSKLLSEILVATDNLEILDLAKSCGVEAVMTPSELPSGSDRVWAAVQNKSCDYIVNIQGDEPLIEGKVLDTLAEAFHAMPQMATLARNFKNREELYNVNFAKIALNEKNEAVYFSRVPIPHPKEGSSLDGFHKHIGIYGYSWGFLKTFCETPPCQLEKTESLEQLRALWLGAKIKVVLTDYESWGVDTPEDVVRVEEILLKKRSIN